MKCGDVVWLLGKKFICIGDHPDGDSMAIQSSDTGSIVKADDGEFHFVRLGIWAFSGEDKKLAESAEKGD